MLSADCFNLEESKILLSGKGLNHKESQRPSDSHSKPYLHRENNIRFGTRFTKLLQFYELQGKQLFVSHFSRLQQHAIEKG